MFLEKMFPRFLVCQFTERKCLNTYNVPGTDLCSGNTAVSKKEGTRPRLIFTDFAFLIGKVDINR